MEDATLLVQQIRSRLDEVQGQAKMLIAQQEEVEQSIQSIEGDITDHEEVLQRYHDLEGTWRGRYEKGLSALGSRGLTAIFHKEMEVVLEDSIKRGVLNLDLALITDGLRTKIKGAKGGSVAQVLAFLLRLFTTISVQPPLTKFFALDEPFSMVSTDYRPALCTTLREMIERLDAQFLFSSHEDELLDAADVGYLVRGDDRGTVDLLKSTVGEQL